MTDSARAAAAASPRRRSFFNWKIALAALVVIVINAAGAGYYLYFLRQAPARQAAAAEPALPFYLKVKPFVVSLKSSDGTAHFVQVGVNLTLPGPAVGKLINAILPEVQDQLRITALRFRPGEIETPAGIAKMRAAMTADLNHLLLRRLGAERIKQANAGSTAAVRNIYFSQLVIE